MRKIPFFKVKDNVATGIVVNDKENKFYVEYLYVIIVIKLYSTIILIAVLMKIRKFNIRLAIVIKIICGKEVVVI